MSGIVVCPQVTAAEVAVDVLRSGGNAIDAAVAGAFVQMVVDPCMCGIGGFGSLICYQASSRSVAAVEFSAKAGSLALPGQWKEMIVSTAEDRFGYCVEGNLNEIGYQSIGVPGVIDGLGVAHAKWGSLPWRSILQSAIECAARGFTVTESVYDFWTETEDGVSGLERLQATEECARLFTREGQPLRVGELCVQSDLANTLAILADKGPRSFYEGEISEKIIQDFVRNGAHITAEDLRGYRAQVVSPVTSTYRHCKVFGVPPPSSGVTMARMLSYLEEFDLPALGHNSVEMIQALVEAMRYGIAARIRYGDDPDFHDIRVADLIDSERAHEAARGAVDNESRNGVDPVSPESPHTTQMCVADERGNAVSLTHSLGASSGVVTRELGFIYNNYMNCFNPMPGFVDSIEPGKRRISNMAPTLVVRQNELIGVLGAPGATRIPSSLCQVLVNLLDFGMSPVEAVSAPRVHTHGGPIELEGRIPKRVADALIERGYRVRRRVRNYDPYFARPQLVVRVAGGWRGASDPRSDGGISLCQ